MKNKRIPNKGHWAEGVVLNILWKYGYSAKRINSPYDILLDEKIKIEVKTSKMRHHKKRGFFWTINRPFYFHFDILVIVLQLPFDKNIILYLRNKEVGNFFKQYDSKFIYAIGNKDFIKEYEKSPLEVFGVPKRKLMVDLEGQRKIIRKEKERI